MPEYNDLRPSSDEKREEFSLVFPELTDQEKAQIIRGILDLRNGLQAEIVSKQHEDNLIIASWNIKEFGFTTQRRPEAYFYIAEILSKFDLIAIQEVKSTVKDLEIVMRLLGTDWDYLLTDITEGDSGNSERFAYIFDKRRVQFAGLAGEIVLWDDIIPEDSPIKQLKRTPFITSFRAGWKEFAVINVHLHPDDNEEDRIIRRAETALLMKAIKVKLIENRLWSENLMMLGDFNFFKGDDDMVELIKAVNFQEHPDLENGRKTNVSGTERYDRIFFLQNEYFEVFDRDLAETGAGVFDFFEFVYTDANVQRYHDLMREQKEDPSTLVDDDAFLSYYRNHWRRRQMSDHLPIWLEMSIDSSALFLNNKLERLLPIN